MSKTPLSISITSPTTSSLGDDDGFVSIRIEDALSGELLAALDMSAGRFWRLAQGSYQNHMGLVSDHLDRVGKKRMNEQIKVPGEVYKGLYKDAEVKPMIEAWLADARPAHWEKYRIAHHNWGWSVTGYWWEEVTPEQVQTYIDERLI